MRSRRAAAVVLLFVVIVGSASYYYFAYVPYFTRLFKESEQQQAIIDQVRPQIETCKSMRSSESKSVVIRGKALVWDMRSNRQHGAYGRLPGELKATSADKIITIFAVIGERLEQVGTYEISHEPVYREYVDICVVYWPEQKVVGSYWVVSKEPPSARIVEHTPEYGDPTVPIADWIASLLREEAGTPTTMGTPTTVGTRSTVVSTTVTTARSTSAQTTSQTIEIQTSYTLVRSLTAQSTSPGATSQGEWKTIATFTGSGYGNTEDFTVLTNYWRIVYTIKAENEQYARFYAFVYPSGETRSYVASLDLRKSGTETSYVRAGPGDFWIEVLAANLQSWTIEVQTQQ